MDHTGLSHEHTELLKEVFRRHTDINSVVLFGSRAKGTAKHNSDIDLAIFGIDDDLRIEAIAMELESLPLPYKFDVKSNGSIGNRELTEHIQRVGITIYMGTREEQKKLDRVKGLKGQQREIPSVGFIMLSGKKQLGLRDEANNRP